MSQEEVRGTVVYRSHWSKHGDDARHAPYRDMLHDPEHDEPLSQASMPLTEMLDAIGCEDGDEVEITVRKTGRRPFEGKIYARTRPHHYEQVDAATYEGPDDRKG